MITHAIFDFDGTLADTMPVWSNVGSALLLEWGINPPVGLDDTLRTMSLADSCQWLQAQFLPQVPTKALLDMIDTILKTRYRDQSLLKPGAKQLLNLLAKQGTHLCVLSATPKHLVEQALGQLGIAHYFDFVWGGLDSTLTKDDPQLFVDVAQKLGCVPKNCFVFEDSLHAIKSASAAGCQTVAVYDAAAACDQQHLRRLANVYLKSFVDLSVLKERGSV